MRSERGFTLVEVLVAFTILALTVASAYAALSSGLRAESRARTMLGAALAARSMLAEVGASRPLEATIVEETDAAGRVLRLDIAPVEPVGVTPVRRAVAAWRVSVEVSDAEGPLLDLSEIKLGGAP